MFKTKTGLESISKELLRVVFLFYFSITILMTIGQFIIEYYHTKDNIKNELKLIATTFTPSLDQALWNFDDEQISSIVEGALKMPTVLGVYIYSKKDNKKIYAKYLQGFNPKNSGVFYHFVDIYHTKNNKKIYLATVNYYTNSNIVIDRVKIGFIIIIINALLKSLILTILFIWAFNKYLTLPLQKITKSIQSIDLHTIDSCKLIEVDKTKNNELTFLSNAFNETLQNLASQLKKLQQAQEHILKAEKMASLGNMVAGIAHEINTPIGMALTGITYLEEETQKIKQLYDDENISEDDFEEYLETSLQMNKSIQINLNKAATLIRSFKAIAVDQSDEEERRLKLYEYLNEIVLSLHNKIKKTNITIQIHCDKDLEIFINAGAISQIFTNLIMNSLIHAFKDGEKGLITIEVYKEDDILYIIYKDDGIGLSDEVKRKIFEPFFTTKRGSGGSGLGTSILYNLITNVLHGNISIESSLNNGVVFNISLPIKSNSGV